MQTSRLASTGLIKRLSGEKSRSLRSAFAISERIGLRGGAMLVLLGARGTDLDDREMVAAGLLTGAGVALIAACFVI